MKKFKIPTSATKLRNHATSYECETLSVTKRILLRNFRFFTIKLSSTNEPNFFCTFL